MALLDIFVGSVQSKYAAIALLVAIAAVSLTVLFSKEKVSLGQKLTVIVLMFLLSLPALLYSLFQLTCLVTGSGGPGLRGKTWWCGVYAWVIAAPVILYSVLIVVMSLLSLTAEKESKQVEQFYAQKEILDNFAGEMVQEEEKKQEGGEEPAPVPAPAVAEKPVEGFEGMEEEATETFVNASSEGFSSCGAPWPPA